MSTDEILSRLEGVKRNGDGWMARCPAHEDNTPSLSIHEGRDGVLLKCFAGCSFDAIVGSLGIEAHDVFANNSSRDIIATYDYTDEKGTLLYQVVRFAPKDFRQRRPDGMGRWEWKLNGTPRVLYRLPDLKAAIAAGKRVFVVEGEKDAEAVRREGFAATCNSGGAGKWRPEYSAELRGADVVIVADRDKPGSDHAQHIARSLRDIAAKVVVVEAAEGKDVSDHLAAGKTLRELVPVTTPTQSDGPPSDGLTHIRDLLAEPDDAVSWIVEGILPAGGLSVLAGKPKGGKSTLARALALRVSRGEPILGRTTTPGPVIYLGLEDPRRTTKSHLRRLGAQATDDLYVWTGTRPDAALSWLQGVLGKVDPVLVVVDTLQHLLGVSDLNDYARVVTALGPVLALVRPRRVHLLLIHHAGKGERSGFDAILGSTAILGTVDTALLLRRREDDTRTLATRQRTGDDVPESVITLDEHQEPRLEGTRTDYDARQAEGRVLDWLKKQSDPVGRAEVLAGVEGDNTVVTRALYALAKAGEVIRTGRGMKGDPFLYGCLPACLKHIEQAGKPASETAEKCPDSVTIPACSDSEDSEPQQAGIPGKVLPCSHTRAGEAPVSPWAGRFGYLMCSACHPNPAGSKAA